MSARITAFYPIAPLALIGAGAVLLSVGGRFIAAQENLGGVSTSLASVTDRFFSVQDEAGFLWQSLNNGAILAGDSQYFQSGLNLIVDGEPFAPQESETKEPSAETERISVNLRETRTWGSITRDLWFDTKRSAVRVWDTVSNSTQKEKSVTVVLRTTYPFSWQSLHGTGGGLVDPAAGGGALQPSDVSLDVHFSPSDGRQDTILLFGSEKGGQKPEIKASSNSRELLFTYHLTIPSGQSRGLLHWILQRNVTDIAQDAAILTPLIQRGQWMDAGIDPVNSSLIVNLTKDSFPVQSSSSTQLQGLAVLNELTDQLGLYRRDAEMLWLGPTNGLSGSLSPEGSVTLMSTTKQNEEITASVVEIAAIQGGIRPRLFLRDGRVLTGELAKSDLSWTTKGAPSSEPLDLNDVYLLLLKIDEKDGQITKGATHYIETVDGNVIAFTTTSPKTPEWASAYGRQAFVWTEFVEYYRWNGVSPQPRILLSGGSLFPVAVADKFLAGTDVGANHSVNIPMALVKRIWRAGSLPVLKSLLSEEWVDFQELPEGLVTTPAILLSGNQILSGSLAKNPIPVRSDTATWKVDGDRVASLSRSLDPETRQQWKVQLLGGETIMGEISTPVLELIRPDGTLAIPLSEILSYKNPKTE